MTAVTVTARGVERGPSVRRTRGKEEEETPPVKTPVAIAPAAIIREWKTEEIDEVTTGIGEVTIGIDEAMTEIDERTIGIAAQAGIETCHPHEKKTTT